jgi:hypothetical protein
MTVGRRAMLKRGHRDIRSGERWKTAGDTDCLLVLGGSGVVLFDGEFFAGVLSVNPILGEVGKILASLKIELTVRNKCSDFREELFSVA